MKFIVALFLFISCSGAHAQSIIGSVTYADCSDVLQDKPASSPVGEVVGAVIGGVAGQKMGRSISGRHIAEASGAAHGANIGERATRSSGTSQNSSSKEYSCLITVRASDGQEVDAVHTSIRRPQVGTTVRVHKQQDGTYSNLRWRE